MTAQLHFTRAARRNRVHAVLWQFPVVCFSLTLLTDIAYWQTSNLMWQNFSSWLLFAGLVFGVLAGIAGLIAALIFRSGLRGRGFWICAVGQALVLILALVNSLVHARDGWPAVVPMGLLLSALTVCAILVIGWLNRDQADPYHAGGTNHG